FSNSLWEWEGKEENTDILMRAVYVDIDYFKTLGIEIVEGRSFSPEFPTDAEAAIMVNETAATVMNMDSPLGKWLGRGDFRPNIIGVVKNYHYRSIHTNIDPLILMYDPNNVNQILVSIKPENIEETMGQIENIWDTHSGGLAFEPTFLEDNLADMYAGDRAVGKIFRYMTFFAIFISCLGLFGLASYTTEQRTKEIGIRKVLGASTSGIALLFTREFTKWVFIANILAWPIAWLLMNELLQVYAYKTSMGKLTFILAGVLSVLIAVFTILYQILRSARSNPIDAIRYE
ncbi:ABC transporter permease, partial [candidate division KSB1 bacterium]